MNYQTNNSNDLLCPKCQQAGRSVPVICNEGIYHTMINKSGILASSQEFITCSQVARDLMAPQKPESAVSQVSFSIIILGILLTAFVLFYLTIGRESSHVPIYIEAILGILLVFGLICYTDYVTKIAIRKDKNNEEKHSGQMKNYNALNYCDNCHLLFDNVRNKFEMAHTEGFRKMIYYSPFKRS